MKFKITSFFLLFLFSIALSGQEIVERETTMSKGVHNGFYIELPGAQKKVVQNLWKDYLKEYAKKVKDKKKEYYTEKAKVPIINGSAELTVYGKVEEGKNMSTLYTWVDLGGAWLNSDDHVTQHEGLEQFLDDFFLIVKKDVIKRELEKEEDKLKDIDKSLRKLVSKNEDLHDDIKKAQEKIRKAESEIETNLKDQDEVNEELEMQKERIKEIIERYNKVGKGY